MGFWPPPQSELFSLNASLSLSRERCTEPCFFFPFKLKSNSRSLLKDSSFCLLCFLPLFNDCLAFNKAQVNMTSYNRLVAPLSPRIVAEDPFCVQDWAVGSVSFGRSCFLNVLRPQIWEMGPARSHRVFSPLCGKPQGWQGIPGFQFYSAAVDTAFRIPMEVVWSVTGWVHYKDNTERHHWWSWLEI